MVSGLWPTRLIVLKSHSFRLYVSNRRIPGFGVVPIQFNFRDTVVFHLDFQSTVLCAQHTSGFCHSLMVLSLAPLMTGALMRWISAPSERLQKVESQPDLLTDDETEHAP